MPKGKKKSFTLIELLIVVSLISILSGVILSVINTKGIKSKSRDSQRIADVKKLQTALELYFSDNRKYPLCVVSSVPDSPCNYIVFTAAVTPSFVGYLNNTIPLDPLSATATGTTCATRTAYNYYYLSTDGTTYSLITTLELATSNPGTANVCYIVKNPL